MKKIGIPGVILFLILLAGAGFYVSGFSSKLTPEEAESYSREMVKEFNQYFYDQHGEKPWYFHLSDSEVTLNVEGEAVLKLYSKDFVKSGDEPEILEAALGFFSESVRDQYKVKKVKVQIMNPDNKLIEEKSGP